MIGFVWGNRDANNYYLLNIMWSKHSETLSVQGIGGGYVNPELYCISVDVECNSAVSLNEGRPGEDLGSNDYEKLPF